jgi:heme/copper-type cytochrome/quinol oxidase subunit 2
MRTSDGEEAGETSRGALKWGCLGGGAFGLIAAAVFVLMMTAGQPHHDSLDPSPDNRAATYGDMSLVFGLSGLVVGGVLGSLAGLACAVLVRRRFPHETNPGNGRGHSQRATGSGQ